MARYKTTCVVFLILGLFFAGAAESSVNCKDVLSEMRQILDDAKARSAQNDDHKRHIRWMILRDMPEVLRIEQARFDDRWKEEDFFRALRTRNTIGMVVEEGDKVVGFMIYELHKDKLNVVNFAVHPDHRRSGVGSLMIEKLINKLSSHRRNQVLFTIADSDVVGKQFLLKAGFRQEGVVKGHFPDGRDGRVFRYQLADSGGGSSVP